MLTLFQSLENFPDAYYFSYKFDALEYFFRLLGDQASTTAFVQVSLITMSIVMHILALRIFICVFFI